MITITCGQCRMSYRVVDKPVAWKAKCKKCGTVMLIPAGEQRAQRPEMAAPLGPSQPDKQLCDNCGRILGKLERLFPWGEHHVCYQCHQQLQLEADAVTASASGEQSVPQANASIPSLLEMSAAVPAMGSWSLADATRSNAGPQPNTAPVQDRKSSWKKILGWYFGVCLVVSAICTGLIGEWIMLPVSILCFVVLSLCVVGPIILSTRWEERRKQRIPDDVSGKQRIPDDLSGQMTEARAKQISGKSIGKAVLVSGICLLILLIVGCVISLVVHHEHHLCAPVALQPTLPGSRPNYTDEQLAQVGIKDAGGQQFRDEDSNEIVSDEQVADRMTHPPGMGISYYVINLFLGFVGLVFLIALFVELHRLSESQCPACRFYGMAVLLGNEHLGTREIHETRMQNVKVGEGISQMGRVIANYNVPVQERYVETHWREHCKCKYCGHQWSRQRRSQQRA